MIIMGLLFPKRNTPDIYGCGPGPATGIQTEYEAFRDKVVAELSPQGFIEETLAEGVAGNLWRIKRAAEAEVAVLKEFESSNDCGGNKIRWDALLRSELLEKIQRFEGRAVSQVEKILKILKEVKENGCNEGVD